MSLKLTFERFKSLEIIYAPHKEDDLRKAEERLFIPPKVLQSHARIIRHSVRPGEGPLNKRQTRRMDSLSDLEVRMEKLPEDDVALAKELIKSWEKFFQPLPIDIGATLVRNLENLLGN